MWIVRLSLVSESVPSQRLSQSCCSISECVLETGKNRPDKLSSPKCWINKIGYHIFWGGVDWMWSLCRHRWHHQTHIIWTGPPTETENGPTFIFRENKDAIERLRIIEKLPLTSFRLCYVTMGWKVQAAKNTEEQNQSSSYNPRGSNQYCQIGSAWTFIFIALLFIRVKTFFGPIRFM